MCVLKCNLTMCKKEFNNSFDLIRHLKFHIRCHYEILCPYVICNKKYSVVSSFSSHLSRYRMKNCFGDDSLAAKSIIATASCELDRILSLNCCEDLHKMNAMNNPKYLEDDFDLIGKQYASFYCFLQYKQLV